MRLRATFDRVPELYDRTRPGYPPALVQDLVALARISPASRILEIGPGTGQLTVQVAGLGCRITAVELGHRLAAVARRNLGAFPRTEVVVADFEDWPLPCEPFDAVVSATSFHWLSPESRMTKAAAAVHPGGALAIVDTYHVVGGTMAFFEDEQACFERWGPGSLAGAPVPATKIPQDDSELRDSGKFGPATFRRFVHDIEFSSSAYAARLLTYAGTLAMDQDSRAGLLRDIVRMIDERYGGCVTKRYLYQLRVAWRRGGDQTMPVSDMVVPLEA
jgi:SAM-dependent methyltransferase